MPAQAPQVAPPSEARRARLLREIAVEHQGHLRAVARSHSASADDAEDALQSAYAIFLARFEEEEQYAVPWLTTTLKREAWSVHRRRRRESVADDEYSAEHLFEQIPCREPEPTEHAVLRERCQETAQLLRQLKLNEHKALGLLAAGYRYREIMAMTGWTYTKVNRLLAEGRDRLRQLASAADARQE